ncbi:MAG: outer membrane lipoprotein carrier protein LolA [Paludibacter sp.]
MFRKILFFISILTIQFATAQNNTQAEQVLSNLLTTAKTTAIKTGFKLIATDKNSTQTTSGTFTLKANKFILEMDAMKVWFDGKTQWSYIQQNNEVSITEPSEKELADTNPMAILSGFKSKCLIRFSGKIKSDQNHCIEMISNVKNNDIVKIEVQVNKTNGNLFSIKITTKNGGNSILLTTNFQKGIIIADNNFAFNPTKYKGVAINDLR